MASNEFMMVLSGDIPFQCGVCDQGFLNNYQLNMHILTHTGEKPFQCTHCDISFSEENDLKSHMLEHTDENMKIHINVLFVTTFTTLKMIYNAIFYNIQMKRFFNVVIPVTNQISVLSVES